MRSGGASRRPDRRMLRSQSEVRRRGGCSVVTLCDPEPNEASMSKSDVFLAYGKSLLWIALFASAICGVMIIVHVLFVDFIHGNPNRTQGNALSMMAIFPPLVGAVAIAGSFLVFTLPQFFQATLIVAFGRLFGSRARFVALLALPVTTILTWYCYDYLTPSDVNLAINVGPEWTPYQHGISLSRYMKTLGFQASATLFSFLYFDTGFRGGSQKRVIVSTLAIAIVVGGIWGRVTAQQQFQFLGGQSSQK